MNAIRKPWEIPVQYNDDRWAEPEHAHEGAAHAASGGPGYDDSPDERDASDVEEILRRPDGPREEKHYECNDTTPINYTKGPHAQEFGIDDKDEAAVEADEDEFEPIDDDEDFPDDD